MSTAKFNVGDEVVTDFSGRATIHVVTNVLNPATSQSRICYQVEPEVPGSRDKDNPWNEGWIDQAWFRPVKAAQEELFK